MGHFIPDFISFFKDLSHNNNKTWFDENRPRYRQSVKEPFYKFVEEMIVRIHRDNPDVLIRPSEAIFRINRDIRFSKDKTPYKTHMSALISPAGRKARDVPGFYFQLGGEGIRVYSGVHQTPKESLYKIRSYIGNHLKSFEKIINDENFKSHFIEILGEKNKRLPAEFQDTYKIQPLIANKDFYVFADLNKDYILDDDFAEILMNYYYTAKPLIIFLSKALHE
jgi:uncharacterized protein (TIGR02453 family)